MRFENFAHQVEKASVVKPLLSVEAVVCRPVLLLAILGAKQAGDSMAPETNQAAEHVPSGALEGLARAEQVVALGHELFQSF